jgi:hypothetical protein
MMAYNLNKQNNKNCKGNENLIRKNYIYMNNQELKYLNTKIKNIDTSKLTISSHARNKKLITVMEIKSLIKFNLYDIIDYNYIINTGEERILIRSKKIYEVLDEQGNINKCYCKIVICPKDNVIVTLWMNKIEDEERKQKTLKTKYNNNFDIINKTIKK